MFKLSLVEIYSPASTFFLIYRLPTCVAFPYTVVECLLVWLHKFCLYFTTASTAGSKAKCYKLLAKTPK